MSTILVVDDMAIFRDPIASTLQAAGYKTLKAAAGKEALVVIRTSRPDLVLLDVAMPGLDGLSVLKEMRGDPAIAAIPVIMLTALSDKAKVLQAASLGVRDYMLKSQFSLKELLQRVAKHVGKPGLAGATPVAGAPAPAPQARATFIAAPPTIAASTPTATVQTSAIHLQPVQPDVTVERLLTRDEALLRAEKMMQGKTLSGVVAQVITLATSQRSDNAQLAEVIARDAILAARVLQVANTAAYASGSGVVSTIPEAIRNVGCNTVRNIAAAVGVVDAMPEVGGDGFNPIRCWQHSFAVAQLCERLSPRREGEEDGLAYLVGLCHDLGEILFHTHFTKEYQQVMALHARAGKSRATLERQVLGVSRGELVSTIFRSMGLPEAVRRPVEAFHDTTSSGAVRDPLARVLLLAEWYANGSLLASSESSAVAPIPKPAAKAIFGTPDPESPDPEQLRSEAYALTAMLARLSRSAEAELTKPLYPRGNASLWVARDPALSAFDSVTAALTSLAEVDVHDRLPRSDEAADVAAIVVIARSMRVAGFTGADIRNVRSIGDATLPVLWLVGTTDDATDYGDMQPVQYPVALEVLAAFTAKLSGTVVARAA
jgi:CheY-like chemotaxis protein/HD-like signal output (HDOD) protein